MLAAIVRRSGRPDAEPRKSLEERRFDGIEAHAELHACPARASRQHAIEQPGISHARCRNEHDPRGISRRSHIDVSPEHDRCRGPLDQLDDMYCQPFSGDEAQPELREPPPGYGSV